MPIIAIFFIIIAAVLFWIALDNVPKLEPFRWIGRVLICVLLGLYFLHLAGVPTRV